MNLIKNRSGKVRRYIALSLVALPIILLTMLPTIASMRWVYARLLNQVAVQGFDLDIESVRLSWFSPLRLDGLKLRETNKPVTLLTIQTIKTDQGLLSYLWNGLRAARIDLVSPRIDVEWIDDQTNLQRLVAAIEGRVGTSGQAEPTKSLGPLQVQLVVDDLHMMLSSDKEQSSLVALNGIHLDGTYARDAKGSYVHLEPTKILSETELTPELMRLGIGYAIPLLAKSAWFQGRVSLETGVIDIPIDSPLQSKGTAIITLHEAKSGPTEPEVKRLLDILARLRGTESVYELVFIDNSKIEIKVADQKVSHKGLEFGFPKVDPRLQLSSAGSVELVTRALDLIVNVPVPLEQLASREKVRELGVPTIGVAVRGTLDKPQVDLSAMRGESADLIALVRQRLGGEAPAVSAALGAIEGLAGGEADVAIGAAVDLIREIQRRRQASRESQANRDSQANPEGTNPEATIPAAPGAQPIRDALRNRLRRDP
jgi:hypothetical protein